MPDTAPEMPAELIHAFKRSWFLTTAELLTDAEIRAALAVLSEQAWIVPKIPHDQDAPCGPRLMSQWPLPWPGWVHVQQEDAQAERIRRYAAQLLAAADAAEAEVAPDGE